MYDEWEWIIQNVFLNPHDVAGGVPNIESIRFSGSLKSTTVDTNSFDFGGGTEELKFFGQLPAITV